MGFCFYYYGIKKELSFLHSKEEILPKFKIIFIGMTGIRFILCFYFPNSGLKKNILYILGEFNCYGDGVHNNEYDYFDYVNKMTDILNYHTISKKLRKEILKDYLDKYLNHNYSLEEKN